MIANSILEALIKEKLSGQELRAVLHVIRKTYGFKKIEDYISLTQFAEKISCSKIRAQQIIAGLVLRNILTVKENINGINRKLLLNKDFDTWATVKKNINRIGKHKRTVKVLRKQPLIKTLTTKETSTKETIKEKEKEKEKEEVVPISLNNPSFLAAWKKWQAYRVEIRHKLTPSTINSQLKKMAGWGSNKAIASIEYSIGNGWRGLFEAPDKEIIDEKPIKFDF